jgi:hypothetical protein
MNISRKTFLQMSAGATALASVSPKAFFQGMVPTDGKIKRGVSLYSYSEEYGVTMTLEDMLADLYNMDARGLEILANSHIEGYPNPSNAWVGNWHAMLEKYNIVPVDYGHWIDSRLHQGRELNTQESYDMLIRDMKLANKLGFKIMRTKMGVIDDVLTPVKNWRDIIQKALPEAEKYDIKMCPEIHSPTVLNSETVDDYVDFIEKTRTKHFGLNIDFSVFQNKQLKKGPKSGMPANMPEMELKPSLPEEIIPLLPYVFCCHAKFYDMSDDFKELTIPYDEVVSILIKQKWDGYLLSEYEGPNKDVQGYSSDQLRKQHIMLINMLGA